MNRRIKRRLRIYLGWSLINLRAITSKPDKDMELWFQEGEMLKKVLDRELRKGRKDKSNVTIKINAGQD